MQSPQVQYLADYCSCCLPQGLCRSLAICDSNFLAVARFTPLGKSLAYKFDTPSATVAASLLEGDMQI